MKRLLLICIVGMMTASQALAQELIKVSGKVLSAPDGEPLIGATVLEEGTTRGAATDLDGYFEFNATEGSNIIASFIGYSPVSQIASANMVFTLAEDNEIEEVVVTGYQVQRKVDLTGSVGIVNSKDIKAASTADPMTALQGKVAGVTITSSGSPSGAATIRIRGIGSFNSSQDPLYIIDGIPTTASLNSLNANDIESMQILKDAASASIYGSRAANGVIVITTKKGKKGDKINVDFNASVTGSFYNNQSKMKLLNTQEYATALTQAALNDGKDPEAYANNYGLTLSANGGTPITVYNPATGKYENYSVGGRFDGYINEKKTMLYSDTDWLDEISRTGVTQNYDLSVSSGSEKGSAMFSLGYKNALGVLKYTDFESFNFRVNSNYKINDYISIGENASISFTNNVDCAPMENALKMAPTVPVYESDGETFAGPVCGMSDRQNPMRELYFNRDNRLKNTRIFANAFVDITPIKNLLLKSNFGVDYNNGYIHAVNYTFHSDVVNNNTASATLSQSHNMNYTWSNTAQYNFNVADVNRFNFLAGMEINYHNYDDFSSYAQDYALENYDYMWPSASTGTQRASGTSEGYRLVSFFGKADYNYNDLLLASVTIRRDGSSRFGKNNRYGTFPSATLGYRLSKNLDLDWLSDLKIRGSWGKTGNQDIANTARFGLYLADYGLDRTTSTAYDLYLQGSGIFPSGYRATQTSNDDLKWESTTQYNIGADYSILNGDIYGAVDLYIKKISDMLINPGYLGAMGEGGNTWQNGPSLRNLGMELSAGYRHNYKNGFGFNASGNIDLFRSKVTYLPEATTGSYEHTYKENLVESGMPYGSRVGYVVEGIFQTQAEVDAHQQAGARVGGLRYADLNDDGHIGIEDMDWIYNPVPDFSWGLNVELTYKDFDFTMFWQGVAGVDVWNNQKYQTDFWSITDAGSNKGTRVLDAWTADNSGSSIPALTTNNTADEGRSSTYYVENGTYAKLRTLQLGYTLPKTILERAGISRARVYVSGNNLLTIKSKSLTCSDPENSNWAYPHYTSISAGVQLSF